MFEDGNEGSFHGIVGVCLTTNASESTSRKSDSGCKWNSSFYVIYLIYDYQLTKIYSLFFIMFRDDTLR